MVIAVFVGTFRHGSSPLASVSLVVFLLLLRASATAPSSDTDVLIGLSIRECLRRAGITEEQAAERIRMDLAAFRRCLRGEGRLQLGVPRLMRLGLTFWTYFTPTLLYHAARLHAEQVREDAVDAVDAAKALLRRRA